MTQVPCKHDPPAPDECRLCHLFATDDAYNRLWGGNGVVSRRTPLPCVHLGEPTGEMEACLPCENKTRLKVFACAHPVHGVTTLAGCKTCADHAPRLPASTFTSVTGDPPCGVVIGTYTTWPELIELQVRLVRRHCGSVPILIADDCSPCAGDLMRIAASHEGVTYWPNVVRIGHAGGDLSALWKGMLWAQGLRLKVVAKLSQRYLVDTPRWLQDGASDLLASGLPLATQQCRGRETFPLRSEAMLLDVAAWSQAGPMADLSPRVLGTCAEVHLAQVFRSRFGGQFLSWPLLGGEDRYRHVPGVLWHCANTAAEYRELAWRHGLDLSADFHTDGWQRDVVTNRYLHG